MKQYLNLTNLIFVIGIGTFITGLIEVLQFFFLYGADASLNIPQADWVKQGSIFFVVGAILIYVTTPKQTLFKYEEN